MSGALSALFDLTGRVALITGGSRGLGLQIARALGEFGATLALVARKRDELDAAVESLIAAGCTAVGFAADLRACEAAAQLTERVMATLADTKRKHNLLPVNVSFRWGTSHTAKTTPHTSVSVLLTCLKMGLSHTSRGTDSRAYCSVKGVKISDPRTTSARSPLDIACA